MAASGTDISEEVTKIEEKAAQALAELYAGLTPWQKTLVARHPQRPHFTDFVSSLITEFTPLAGDRAFADDAAVLGGMVWALENPRAGLVEADGLDHARVLEVAEPYLGDMVGAYSDWTPLLDRGRLFPEAVDEACPWQFGNFRVM